MVDFVAHVPVPSRLREPLTRTLRGEPSDWPDSLTSTEINALVAHGVAPLIYANAQVPQLRNEAMYAAAFEPLRANDIDEVLTAVGVDALILKGTALAYDLYPEPELRPRSDTDLLIAHNDLPRVRDAMRTLGFEEVPSSGDEHGLRQAVFTRELGMVYDVHWSATNVPAFDAVLRYDDLRTRSLPLPRLGERTRGLSYVDALLMACIHRVAHHHDSDRLIWLIDIDLLRRRMSRDEHERFWRIAAEGRVVGVCERSVAAADEWLGRAPENLASDFLSKEERTRDEPSRVFLDRDITHAGVMAASLRALPWRAKITRLRQLAFPPAEFIRQQFGARNPLTLPWWYVYRAVRGAARLFRSAGR